MDIEFSVALVFRSALFGVDFLQSSLTATPMLEAAIDENGDSRFGEGNFPVAGDAPVVNT